MVSIHSSSIIKLCSICKVFFVSLHHIPLRLPNDYCVRSWSRSATVPRKRRSHFQKIILSTLSRYAAALSLRLRWSFVAHTVVVDTVKSTVGGRRSAEHHFTRGLWILSERVIKRFKKISPWTVNTKYCTTPSKNIHAFYNTKITLQRRVTFTPSRSNCGTIISGSSHAVKWPHRLTQ